MDNEKNYRTKNDLGVPPEFNRYDYFSAEEEVVILRTRLKEMEVTLKFWKAEDVHNRQELTKAHYENFELHKTVLERNRRIKELEGEWFPS